MSNHDELARIMTPAVFNFVRRAEMPWANDVGKAIHEGNLTRYEFPKGYVIRSKAQLMNLYDESVHSGCAFVFHRAKAMIPRIVWQVCEEMGIPARLLDEDRVVINPKAEVTDILQYPPWPPADAFEDEEWEVLQ